MNRFQPRSSALTTSRASQSSPSGGKSCAFTTSTSSGPAGARIASRVSQSIRAYIEDGSPAIDGTPSSTARQALIEQLEDRAALGVSPVGYRRSIISVRPLIAAVRSESVSGPAASSEQRLTSPVIWAVNAADLPASNKRESGRICQQAGRSHSAFCTLQSAFCIRGVPPPSPSSRVQTCPCRRACSRHRRSASR